MDRIHSYPKVYNLGHPAVDALTLDPVIVQEKVDGSQFSFGEFGGKLVMRSKGAEVYAETADKLFRPAVEKVLELHNRGELREGWAYRCETLCKVTHNALSYDRVPKGNLVLFDIEFDESRFADPELVDSEAVRLGLEPVPLLFSGILKLDTIEKILKTPSVLGGPFVEGVVVKNYTRFGKDGKVLMGKHVQEKFREVHSKKWGEANPKGTDIIERIAAGVGTEARYHKAVQHLAERGELEHSPRDIGALIKEVREDSRVEVEEQVMRALFEWAWPAISRKLTGPLPQWYKDKLLVEHFEEAPVAAVG